MQKRRWEVGRSRKSNGLAAHRRRGTGTGEKAAIGGVSCFCLAGGIYCVFALRRVARMGGRKPTFLLGRLECNDTGIARGVFGWILKKFGRPPSAWRGRKGLRFM